MSDAPTTPNPPDLNQLQISSDDSEPPSRTPVVANNPPSESNPWEDDRLDKDLEAHHHQLRTPDPEELPSINPEPTPEPVDTSPHRDLRTPDPSTFDPSFNAPSEPVDTSPHHDLHTPDPSAFDTSFSAPSESEPISISPRRPLAEQAILNEFDPLADERQQAAEDAWAATEGHPAPPPPPPKPSTPPPIAKSPPPPVEPIPVPSTPELPTQRLRPNSGSGFPAGLAAFARSFSIPNRSKPRPTSLDVAQSVGSPRTLSDMASRQQQASRAESENESKAPGGGGGDSNQNQVKEGQFDFQSFLDQMKTRSAEPVAKYLRSFLGNFAKRTFTVNDQIRVINDFLNFIAGKMRENEMWREASDAEFDNAMEGMEKLVMNRLYDFTYTPAAARLIPPRPVNADDLERDRVLAQRIALFTWIEERHLDIPEGEGSKGFLMFAQQELLKINHYKAPRDKLICILNCCKVIFGLIRHLKTDEGADSFVPILIYVVLKANPPHLLSNVEFINRFRNPEKLQSEAGYYLSSLMGAVSFIETMDHTSLSNISQEEFEKNVEDAIQSLPEQTSLPSTNPSTPQRNLDKPLPPTAPPYNSASSHAGEESANPLSLPAPSPGPSDNARRFLQKTGDTISKPLSTLRQIFNEALDGAENTMTYLPGPFMPFEFGREKRHDGQDGQPGAGPSVPHWSHPDQIKQFAGGSQGDVPQTPLTHGEAPPPIQTPYKPRVRRVVSSDQSPQTPDSLAYQLSPENTPTRHGPQSSYPLAMGPSQPLPPRVQSLAVPSSGESSPHVSRTATPNLDFVGMQEEIDIAHQRQAEAARSTLTQIFPSADAEVIGWVLEANEFDVGKSIEAMLEVTGDS